MYIKYGLGLRHILWSSYLQRSRLWEIPRSEKLCLNNGILGNFSLSVVLIVNCSFILKDSKESKPGPTHYIIPTFGHFQSLSIDQLQSPYNIFNRTNLSRKITLYRFEKVLCLPLKTSIWSCQSPKLIHSEWDPTLGKEYLKHTDLEDDIGLLGWVKGTETSGRNRLKEHPTATLCYL